VAEDWSLEEVAATAADYFVMLDHQLRGEPYNKRDHNRRLQELLHGLGYDILSFETGGRERLIEVKTTSFGAMTPFFASKREVAVSEEQSSQFSLYRVFKFRQLPKVFVLSGSLTKSCILDPVQYRASLL
jgi:uncharacterized protein DUF3883